MLTPNTLGPFHHIATPSNNRELATARTEVQWATAPTVRLTYNASIVILASEDTNDTVSTLDVCLRAVITAAERMVTLVREPQSIAVVIAYDECLDIITAAVNQIEETVPQGATNEHVLQVYQAMRSIYELLRPSPSVRRALHF
ncbi:unnamed protein product [Peronospora effusa]|nr:unnamed protein product [Peronospora effusa]